MSQTFGPGKPGGPEGPSGPILPGVPGAPGGPGIPGKPVKWSVIFKSPNRRHFRKAPKLPNPRFHPIQSCLVTIVRC